MKDNFGREINYMRISVTDRCNLRCKYCMPETGVENIGHESILSFEDIERIVKAAVKLGIHKFRITGGEPLVRKGIVSLIEKLSAVDGVEELVLTTNGILLKEYAADLKKAGLDRVNISIDTFFEEKYAKITRGGDIYAAMDGLEAAVQAGLTPIKINVVVMKGFNDDEIMNFAQLTINEAFDVRFIELMPVGHADTGEEFGFISNAEIKGKISGLVPVPSENSVADYYKFPEGLGRIGFISPMSNHFCSHCNKIRITADGRLKPCLHSNEEFDLSSVLKTKDDEALKLAIENAILQKSERHFLRDGAAPIERDMNKIGG
jgi:cyclic pyranopterin phosphate synthase